jgi:hypothetical protein
MVKPVFAFAKDILPLVCFGLALAIMLIGYGYLVGARQVFPYAILKEAKSAGVEFWNWAELYLPFRKPEDHPHVILWHEPAADDSVHNTDSEALTFITAYQPGGFALFLVDAKGERRHEWRIPPSALAQLQGADRWRLPAGHDAIMGAHLYADGDVVFNINFKALVRIDRCSNLVWYLKRNAHHSVFVDDEGFIWLPGRRLVQEARDSLPQVLPPFWDDLILKVSPDGKVVQEISLLEALFQGDYLGLVLEGLQDRPRTTSDDPLHLNDVELVSADFARHNDFAKEGDILVSMRTIDAVALVDKDSHQVKYAMSGNVLRQHDPDALDNGNILVFDNRTAKGQHNEARYLTEPQAFGYSRLVEIDPQSLEVVWSFEGTEEAPLYTSIQGAQEQLDNGNVLVVESEGGRVFEVDRESREIVWQFRNRIGNTEAGTLLGRVTGAARHRASDLPFLGSRCD